MALPDVTLLLFNLFGVLRFGSYLPQISRVMTANDGARAISYSTWLMWIGSNVATAAYALVNLSDWALFAVSTANTSGCVAVVLLTVWKRHQFARLSPAS